MVGLIGTKRGSMSDSDFIREVDEDLRDEQLKNMWDRFGPFVIGAALLIVLATAANNGWNYWKTSQAAKSGDAFIAAIDKSESGATEEAIAALETLKAEGSGGYPVLARMRLAAEAAKLGRVDDAIGQFLAIAGDASIDTNIQDLARIRAAGLQLDQGQLDQVITELSSMMDQASFRHSARELVLLAHMEKSEFDKARPIAERIANDAETPAQLRQRAEIYVNYLTSRLGSAGKETS